ncbi:MAG: hypothetical protein QXL67_00185 [Candidatus Bathyarchaeia archaeon]
MNRLVVRQHIKTLVDGGLVQKRSYGGVFLFTLTLESIEGRALKDFFDKTLK